MRDRYELTAERLRELLDYDTMTGAFWWKPRKPRNGDWGHKIFNTRYAGKRAGCFDAHAYIQITVDRRNYKAHRLAGSGFTARSPPIKRLTTAIAIRPITQSETCASQPDNSRRATLEPASRATPRAATGTSGTGNGRLGSTSMAGSCRLGLSSARRTPRLLALRLRQSTMVNGPTPPIPSRGPRHDRHC